MAAVSAAPGAEGLASVALPLRGEARPRRPQAAAPRHRIATKTPRGLAGRMAELASARTTETAGALPGAALAECILQVTGPPNVTRAAAKARRLLRWLRAHTRGGAAKVCGRSVTPADVREAERLVGDVWCRRLVKLQRAKSKRRLQRTATETSLASAVASGRGPGREDAGSSDDESEVSDLSGEEDVDSEEGAAEAEGFVDFKAPEVGYRGDWRGAPELGTPAFSAFAAEVLRRAGIAQAMPGPLEGSAACPPLQPHQEAAVFLLHPTSPVNRLLIDHPTGSGKTREMIEVLDGYFQDPRPKVPVFPKEPVCRNFYGEMLRWPSRYRDYFCCLRPHSAARASSVEDWRARRRCLWDIGHLGERELRALCREMREVLEMKGCFYMGRMRRIWREDFTNRFPNEPLPAAPLRALRYTSAGGRHTALRAEDGLPVSALFKVGFSRDDANVYSNKIVVMDEVHNLVRSHTQFGEQLLHLRDLLFQAKGMVLAGFTGTPILSEPQEGRQLLDIIKGASAPLGDAGFISSFPMRPPSLFPLSLPLGIPDAVLTAKLRRRLVQKVALTGESLQRYDRKRAAALPSRRLQRYCNLSVHFGAMHEGKGGSKARVLQDLESCAPKLFAIARDVAAESSKTLVLVARHSGMDALIAHLRQLASPRDGPQTFGVATMDELAAFNSRANLHGELYRVLIADSTQCGEGVSFFSVRRVMLADIPACPSTFVQAVGRAIRMYGHDGLPEEMRTVTTTMYVSVMPRWMRSTLGAWAYRALRHHEPQVAQAKAKRFLRKLLKVGIHSLEALRERLLAFFPREARAAAASQEPRPPIESPSPEVEMRDAPSAEGQEGAAPLPAADTCLALQECAALSQISDESTATGSPSRAIPSTPLARRDSCESEVPLRSARPALSGKGHPVRLPQAGVAKFLESLGLWKEAKSMGAASSRESRAQEPGAVTQGSPSRRLVRRASKDSARKGGRAQHWLLRGLQWLLEDELDAVVQRLALASRSADEEALRSLAERSRAFVPALRELRREAIDREALERLVAAPAEPTESAGETSDCDFGVSAGSSSEDVPPLVLPSDWQLQRVKRGRAMVRQFVDPSGKRYKTEAEARKAVDEVRRSANMSSRLKERFEARLAAKARAPAATAGA